MVAGAASILVGAAIMMLWLSGPSGFAAVAPVVFVMQFNTAVCFVLSGTALCLLQTKRWKTASAVAAVAGLFASLILAQHLFGVDLGMDRLFIEPFIAIGANAPGRMSANTAICFFLISMAILVTGVLERTSPLRIVLAGAVFMISTSALLGFLINITTPFDWLPLARMSPHTALCFVGLSAGLIFPEIARLGYHPAVVAASLAAATYFLLLVLTYAELYRQEVLFTQALPAGKHSNARSTLIALLLLSGTVFASLIAYAFQSAQRSLYMARQLSKSEKHLAAIINTAVDGFVVIDERGTILSVNPACERIFGYSADEMLGRNPQDADARSLP